MKKDDQIDSLLAGLWQKNLPILQERLDILDLAAAAAASGNLAEASRLEAYNVAHKLSGSLGMFGYQHGTEIARRIEQILKSPTPDELASLSTLASELRVSLADGLVS